MMASEKEIEAAAKAIYENSFSYDPLPWDSTKQLYKRPYLNEAKITLEAAEKIREICTTTSNDDMEAGCCGGCRTKQERLAAEKVREEK